MFTGIVRHIGVVKAKRVASSGRRMTIDLGPLAEGLKAGDSVAVSGACLTAASISGTAAQFDAVAETLAKTTLGGLKAGSRVNLELALRLGDGLDGHLVQGHVDGVARVRAIRSGGQHVVEFSAPAELTESMIPKGSVAIDGVSLTLVDVGRESFSAALIPTTLAETTLGDLKAGSAVNVETDLIGKYVRKCLGQVAASGGVTMEKLREAGFA